MVIGSGMIARRFKNYTTDDNFLIFASGVSNSKSNSAEEYLREFNLLGECLANNDNQTLVYFSTTSVADPGERDSAYISHKLNCERVIEANAKSYVIFRVSNLVGKSPNPNTVLNFFTHHISGGIGFNLWMNAERNLIDVDDFYAIADYILQNKTHANTIINIANPKNHLVKEIVDLVAQHYNQAAVYEPVLKGERFSIDVSGTDSIIELLKINFGGDYLERLLEKYYG